MSERIKRNVPEKDLEPGKIPRWHVRYSSGFCLQGQTNRKLESLRKRLQKQFDARARLVVSDMGEMVVIFEERKSSGTPKTTL